MSIQGNTTALLSDIYFATVSVIRDDVDEVLFEFFKRIIDEQDRWKQEYRKAQGFYSNNYTPTPFKERRCSIS